jgi:hypothetical protein
MADSFEFERLLATFPHVFQMACFLKPPFQTTVPRSGPAQVLIPYCRFIRRFGRRPKATTFSREFIWRFVLHIFVTNYYFCKIVKNLYMTTLRFGLALPCFGRLLCMYTRQPFDLNQQMCTFKLI